MTDVPVPDDRSIYARMVAILAELPAIGKNQRNQQQGFMFRGHDDVMNELNPLLAKHGVFVVPFATERIREYRQTKSGGTMFETNLLVTYRFYGLGGDFVEAAAWGEGTDSGDKDTSKAMTMAFKTVLNQAFAISTEEFGDPDGGTPEPTTRREEAAAFDPGAQLLEGAPAGAKFLQDGMKILTGCDAGVDWPALVGQVLRDHFGVEQSKDIPKDRFPEFAHRYANACAATRTEFTPDAVPPIDDAGIVRAWSWAFGGLTVTVPRITTDDLPDFGGGN